MTGAYAAISPIITANVFFQLGNGLLTTVIGVRLDAEGLSTQVAGLVFSSYYGGLLLGTIFSRDLIFRVGHIRSFAIFAAISAVTILLQALWVDAVLWAVLRAIAGFSIAALFMIIESWLNMRATNESRGIIFSIYTVTNFFAIGVGQLLLNLYGARGFETFSIVAILVTLALVPVAVTRQAAPTQEHRSALRFRDLYRISPVGIVGSFVAGTLLGPVFGLLPIFARQIGLSLGEISILMTAVVFGGAVLALPLGRYSDRVDRRRVIVLTGVAIVALAVCATILPAANLPLLLLEGALLGGFIFSVYPLCVAHTNDFLTPDDAVAASSGLLLAFGVGAMIGPGFASIWMDFGGPYALFLYLGAWSAGLVAFVLYRMRQRATVQPEEKTVFVSIAATTPAALELDPWTDAAESAASATTADEGVERERGESGTMAARSVER